MNVAQFLYTLPYMLLGMAGIFTVTIIIIVCIALLNKMTSGRGGDEKKSEE